MFALDSLSLLSREILLFWFCGILFIRNLLWSPVFLNLLYQPNLKHAYLTHFGTCLSSFFGKQVFLESKAEFSLEKMEMNVFFLNL